MAADLETTTKHRINQHEAHSGIALCSYCVQEYGRIGRMVARRMLFCKAENIGGTTIELYIPTPMLMVIAENVLKLCGLIDAVK